MSQSSSPSPSPLPSLKGQKKRKKVVQDGEELEIDVNLPEPPSKKAKRKESKKSKGKKSSSGLDGETAAAENTTTAQDGAVHEDRKGQIEDSESNSNKPKRTDYGVWIGNLAFSTTKDNLRTFLREQGDVKDADIVRIHMPAPADKPSRGPVKPQNKGFAYVDFTTSDVLEHAITLSEKLLGGRRLLIKNAKSFEGRPEKSKGESSTNAGSLTGKEPTKRVFVGNLGFDVSKGELQEHFEQAGEIEDIHMATFEDTGKCKGFAWVTFATVGAAKSAVDGYIYKSQGSKVEEMAEDSSDEEDEATSNDKKRKQKKKKKLMKWFINRLLGRPLRCEFAEDAQTRYKKRFGPGSKPHVGSNGAAAWNGEADESLAVGATSSQIATKDKTPMKKLSKDDRQEERRKRHEAKTASAHAPQPSTKTNGAGAVAVGKKITFD